LLLNYLYLFIYLFNYPLLLVQIAQMW
jgi:hypothetical protein